jgi:hypothetical protein
MAIANPVYANAAFAGCIAAAASAAAPGVVNDEEATLLAAATNFAAAVDAAIVTAQGSAFDATVSASAGITLTAPVSAAETNSLASKCALIQALSQKALTNTYASSGGQTPSVAAYAAVAAQVATSFKSAVTNAGWTAT